MHPHGWFSKIWSRLILQWSSDTHIRTHIDINFHIATCSCDSYSFSVNYKRSCILWTIRFLFWPHWIPACTNNALCIIIDWHRYTEYHWVLNFSAFVTVLGTRCICRPSLPYWDSMIYKLGKLYNIYMVCINM